MQNRKIPRPPLLKKKGGATPMQKNFRLFEHRKDGEGDIWELNTWGNQAEGRKIQFLRIVGMGVVVGVCGWLARYGIEEVPYIGHAPGLFLGTFLLVWLAPKAKIADNGSH